MGSPIKLVGGVVSFWSGFEELCGSDPFSPRNSPHAIVPVSFKTWNAKPMKWGLCWLKLSDYNPKM